MAAHWRDDSAVGNHENRRAADAGVVLSSQGRRLGVEGFCDRRFDPDVAGGIGGAAAGSRYRDPDFCVWLFRDFSCGTLVESHSRWRHRRQCRVAARVELHARIPEAAHLYAARSHRRPTRRGLSHHPIDDCNRFRRRARQRLAQWQPGATRFHSRALDRFHSGGIRRRVWPARQFVIADPVSHHHRSRLDDCNQRADYVFASAGRRGDAHVFHLCVRQYRHGERNSAGSGRAVAVDQLWRNGDFVDAGWVRDIDVDFDA